MRVYYCDHHAVPLPPGHRFPMPKYRALREQLVARELLSPAMLRASEPAENGELYSVHGEPYVRGMLEGTLPDAMTRRIGFPWSPELVSRSLASVGGTIAASDAALDDGFAGNLAGGTHHAHRDFGAGYCVFNDIAIAARRLLARGAVARILVVDVDVHQGDGTAAIFEGDDAVFTLSLHGARNFPFRKARSDLDVELPDGTGDDRYLEELEAALELALDRARPDLMFVQGGVDVLATDLLGRLSITLAGLADRDRLVLGTARRRGIPAVLTLGGGYGEPLEATIEGHLQTYRIAREIHG